MKHPLKLTRDVVDLFFWRTAILLCGPLNVYSVLVGSSQEKGVKTTLFLVSLNDVRHDRRIEMAEVRQNKV